MLPETREAECFHYERKKKNTAVETIANFPIKFSH